MKAVSSFRFARSKVPALGLLALAALVLCTGSGLVLALSYRPGAALDSLALLMMKNPAGVFFRSVHYWSAQVFLVLCLFHVLDHLRQRSESVVNRGVWLRLTLSIPVILYAMLSGFLLRGDPTSTQAGLIFRTMLESVPWVGHFMAGLLLGQGQGLFVVFLHHICTTTLLIWLVTIEHGRRVHPGRLAVIWVGPPLILLSLVLVPSLESTKALVEKGPWYLAGLQEILHWLPGPRWAVSLLLLVLVALALLPAAGPAWRSGLKRALTASLGLYVFLSAVALGFRGEGWRLGWAGGGAGAAFRSYRAYSSPPVKLLAASVPTVDGEREGCLSCHEEMIGFRPSHDPKTIGCASCHLGERFTLDKELAHAGMTLTPANLSIVRQTCASANCHSEIDVRLHASLMTTMSGAVAVDKYVFGESPDLNARFDIRRLAGSPADQHLRTLCASCHLGQDKAEPASIDELSRGGGCSACHLHYDASAREEMHRRIMPSKGQPPRHHPDISVDLHEQACFGCHSRSGRISLSYEGWHETKIEEAAATRMPGWRDHYRVLKDGRVLEKHDADIHFQRGMQCVDCHLASEVMGNGNSQAHKEDAVKIACVDCHPENPPRTATFDQLDLESQKIAALRKLNEPGRRFVLTFSGSPAYPNVFLGDNDQVLLQTAQGKRLRPKPVQASCRDIPGHRRLECRTCHSAWAPQCVECHTTFDKYGESWDHLAGRTIAGAWQETAGDFLAEPPVLGVQQRNLTDTNHLVIATFIPGMIVNVSRRVPQSAAKNEFHRLYAPASPHTTVSRSRSCLSCHADPLAFGYGRGRMTYERATGSWKFEPSFPSRSPDRLPLDAWIPFLREPTPGSSTRTGCRPLNLAEQQKVLLVGTCLQCHTESELRAKNALADFGRFRAQIGKRCLLPDWVWR